MVHFDGDRIRQVPYGRDASALWSGPGLGRIAQGINTAIDYIGRNSARTNTAERKVATSFYDMVIEPTANFALAWLPQRAAASAATIGVIPALRDLFVNETAGEKDRKQQRKDKSEPIRGIFESIIGGN